jgi:hypothetical protein
MKKTVNPKKKKKKQSDSDELRKPSKLKPIKGKDKKNLNKSKFMEEDEEFLEDENFKDFEELNDEEDDDNDDHGYHADDDF